MNKNNFKFHLSARGKSQSCKTLLYICDTTLYYRVFIKYCVFLKILRYIPDSGLYRFPLGVNESTQYQSCSSRTCRVQKNHNIWRKDIRFNEHPVGKEGRAEDYCELIQVRKSRLFWCVLTLTQLLNYFVTRMHTFPDQLWARPPCYHNFQRLIFYLLYIYFMIEYY